MGANCAAHVIRHHGTAGGGACEHYSGWAARTWVRERAGGPVVAVPLGAWQHLRDATTWVRKSLCQIIAQSLLLEDCLHVSPTRTQSPSKSPSYRIGRVSVANGRANGDETRIGAACKHT